MPTVDGDVQSGAFGGKHRTLDRHAHPLGYLPGLVQRGLGQQQAELLAAVPGQHLVAA